MYLLRLLGAGTSGTGKKQTYNGRLRTILYAHDPNTLRHKHKWDSRRRHFFYLRFVQHSGIFSMFAALFTSSLQQLCFYFRCLTGSLH